MPSYSHLAYNIHLGVVSVLLAVGVLPATTEAACTLNSLQGKYFYRDLAVNWRPGGAGQETGAALATVTFDGAGNFTATGQARDIDEQGAVTTDAFTDRGTYTVTRSCNTTLTLSDGTTMTFAMALGGDMLLLTNTSSRDQQENILGIAVRR